VSYMKIREPTLKVILALWVSGGWFFYKIQNMLLGKLWWWFKRENTPSQWWINCTVLMIRTMITQKTFYIKWFFVSIDKKLHKRRKRMIQVAYTYIKNIKRFCRSVVIHTYQREIWN
jgi:hypothetical protein